MNNYGPFKPYTPVRGTPAGEMAKRIKAQFLQTPDKQDWYALQKTLECNMLKVVYAGSGVILQASDDASTLWPLDASVVEVPTEQIPKGFTLPLRGTDWQYNGQRIVPRVYTTEEQQRMAEQRKVVLMREAESVLAPLERAVKLGMATDKEKSQLEAWGRYSVLLSRVNPQEASNITWPDRPVS
ncbi:TPA: tail fiber assembly protein [Serratia marcescens]|nr:tail fiber assembly protein [Serratia marcescens]